MTISSFTGVPKKHRVALFTTSTETRPIILNMPGDNAGSAWPCPFPRAGNIPLLSRWMQFEGELGKLSNQRLILFTQCELTAEEIFSYSARHWPIEDLFNQMKNKWACRETWQQSSQVLHRWTQILSIAYALPQVIAIYCSDRIEVFMQLTPWRKKKTDNSRSGAVGIANDFRQCLGPELVEPDMLKIPVSHKGGITAKYNSP